MNDKPEREIPSDTGAVPSAQTSQPISIADLADRLYRKRKSNHLTLDQAAERIGVSAATLSRLERLRLQDGSEKVSFAPDMRTLAAVTYWTDVPLKWIIGIDAAENLGQGEREVESIPDVVEAHLRADRNLDDDAALALSQMFRIAYDQFSRSRQTEAAEDVSAESHEKEEP